MSLGAMETTPKRSRTEDKRPGVDPTDDELRVPPGSSSWVWHHFRISDIPETKGWAICLHCRHWLKYCRSTSSFEYHLKRIHQLSNGQPAPSALDSSFLLPDAFNTENVGMDALIFGKKTDVLSVDQFSLESLGEIFTLADKFRDAVQIRGSLDILKGRLMSTIFYEPSTRTSTSFQAAMLRLGGSVVPINTLTSSVAKGESLSDTMKTLESYSDIIVIRHPEVGSAQLAAESVSVPVINAGDGIGEHPTQALLDIYTIMRECGRLHDLKITMVGDLKHGRTVHSLSKLLCLYSGISMNFISPSNLCMPRDVIEKIRTNSGITVFQASDLNSVLPETDVLYVTRIQKERFASPQEYKEAEGKYIITPGILQIAKPSCVIMHPLPRVNEISVEVDQDPRAAYFRQMRNGLFVRMALVYKCLGGSKI